MARASTGTVVERNTTRGKVFAIRFRAYGRREYVTLGRSEDGWTSKKAGQELANVLADVRRGIWRPPESEPVLPAIREEPTFHLFASEWLAGREAEGLARRTTEELRWALTIHLLPHFAGHRLSQITSEEVDRYKRAKVQERDAGLVARPLSNRSINRTLQILSQVLDAAVEYGYISTNPAKGRRRRLKPGSPRRASMTGEQVKALFAAAGEHRVLLATAIMAGGLRASEVTALRWRDVDLASGWLHVGKSKTDAGVRRVDLAPHLLDELKAWKAASRFSKPDDFVFPTRAGTRRDRNTLRTRILYPAIERANKKLREMGKAPISEEVTFHSLRRTYASLMAEAGADPRYVMGQIGHRRAEFTLAVYTDVGNRRHAANATLGDLLLGSDWAPMGTSGTSAIASVPDTVEETDTKGPDLQALPEWS